MGTKGRKGKKRKLAEQLFKLLTEDILKRYNNKQHWDPDLEKKEIRKKDVLMKYNHIDYWDTTISINFQKEHNLSDEQMVGIQRTIIYEIQEDTRSL